MLLYTAIFVPFKIAFIQTDSQVMVVFEYIVDIIFSLDILVNFLSATENTSDNTIIYKHKEIAKNYIQSWFVLDLIACFPFQLFSEWLSDEFPSLEGSFGNK